MVGGIGAFCGVVANVLVGINLAVAASSRIPHGAAAQFLVTSFKSGPGQAFLGVYFLGEVIAPVIMGIALWRSRVVSRGVAVLFVVGFELAQQLGSIGLGKVLLLMPPFAVAMLLLAIRLWQTAAVPVAHDQEPKSRDSLILPEYPAARLTGRATVWGGANHGHTHRRPDQALRRRRRSGSSRPQRRAR